MSFRRYPICDTDILVRYCKVELIEDLFDFYSKINISDAVYQEINYNKDKNLKKNDELKKKFKKKYFEKTYISVNEKLENGQANLIEYCELPEEKRQVIDSLLFDEGILYNSSEKSYQLDYNLGEKVSVIYAAVLDIKIILSDDSDTLDLAERFYGLEVIRLPKLLKIMGIKDPEILAEISVISYQDDPIEAKKILDRYKLTGSIDSLLHIGMIEEYKKQYMRNKKTS